MAKKKTAEPAPKVEAPGSSLARLSEEELAALVPTIEPVFHESRRCAAFVTSVEGGGYRIYFARDGGKKREIVMEPVIAHPKDAVALAKLLDARPLSQPEPVLVLTEEPVAA